MTVIRGANFGNIRGISHRGGMVTVWCSDCDIWYNRDDPKGCLCKHFGVKLLPAESKQIGYAVRIPDEKLAEAHGFLKEDVKCT